MIWFKGLRGVPFLMAKHGLSMLSLHFKPMLLEDVANSRDFIVIPPMPYGQRASSISFHSCCPLWSVPQMCFHSIRFKVNNSGSQWRAFFMPSIFPFILHCDTILPPRRRYVADSRPCRHNPTRKSAENFPISQNRRTFASSIRQNDIN